MTETELALEELFQRVRSLERSAAKWSHKGTDDEAQELRDIIAALNMLRSKIERRIMQD